MAHPQLERHGWIDLPRRVGDKIGR